MADAEPLARAICAACAQLHRPHAPLQDINQANVRLIQLCEHAQAPQACVLIVRHGAQLVTQGAPVHACALAANVVERACRERNVSGDDAFALLMSLNSVSVMVAMGRPSRVPQAPLCVFCTENHG